MKGKLAVLVVVAAGVGLPALAQTSSTERIEERQAKQQRRIEEGIRSGELTPREAERLRKGQQRIQRMEERARADGKITPKEAARIERAQDVESRRIWREKHDRQRDLDRDGKADRPARRHAKPRASPVRPGPSR
ncbi:MAG: hypothetical protein N2653_09705 [Burkholderiales bacterium]|nr:hypothetical protein [Burkholderiales bacterium]